MFKGIIIATLLLTGALAEDMNLTVQKYVDTIETEGLKNGGWVITDKKRSLLGESFVATVAKSKLDANASYEEYQQLIGLSFSNDINYTTSTISTVSTLINFPSKDLDKNETAVIKNIIDKKLFVLRGEYSLRNHLYSLSFNDLNESFPEANISTKNIKLSGYYDQNNSDKEQNSFTIESLELVGTNKVLMGEYFIIKNLLLDSQTLSQKDTIDLTYKTSLGFVDSNLSGNHSKAEKVNVDIKIANVNKKSYRILEKLGGENPEQITAKELESLGLNIAMSKNLSIDINDISIASLITNSKNMGSAKIDGKISLDIDPKNAQLVALNPLMALASLKVDASIELSKEMLAMIMKDPRAMMLAFLPPKEKNGNVVYKITYSSGKLIINGQNFLK